MFDYRPIVALTLIESLAAVAREARREADLKQVRIAAALNADQSTIARFERGGQPRDIDAVMRAYADETGIPLGELGKRAVTLWTKGSNNNSA